jgi:response regulator RpfG family c-di-GMP phosphodiesterase
MNSKKILFVDDDRNLLAGFQRTLRKQFAFDVAASGAEALNLVRTMGPYAVIVADMQMPEMDGVELLSKVSGEAPDTVRVMLTGNADQQTAVEAVNRGHIYAFLNKPCDPENLRLSLEGALKQHELVATERELLEGTLAGTMKAFSEVLSMIDPTAFGRGQKLRDSVKTFAQWLQLPVTWQLETAAMLADIGLVSVPAPILRKLEEGYELSARERDIAEKAPLIGHDLLVGIPRMEPVAKMILYQHKNYDGTGFPSNPVAGESIPFGARVLKVLHDRAVLESEGVVKKKAYEAMKGRTRVYDPELLDKCFLCFESFLTNSISADQPVQSVAVHELVPGQTLVSDVKTVSDRLLVSSGNRLTSLMIRRLKNYSEFDRIKEPIYVQ